MTIRNFIIALLLLVVFQTQAQQIIERYQGTSEAFLKRTYSEIEADARYYEPYQAREFRKPNPEVYRPIFEVDPAQVIFMESSVDQPEIRTKREVSPLPDTTFMGLYDSGNSIPPDVNGAPGPEHLMVTLNTQVRIQDRIGNEISTVSLGMFWSGLPGGGTFDPKILYDSYEDRWIFVTCAGSQVGDSRIYMGVSETSDPTGTWFLYSFIADPQNQVWFDYPSMGFNDKWIGVSGNMFGNGFYSTVYVFDKHAMYAGEGSVSFTRFATSLGFTLVPAITFDLEEENLYLVSSANSNSGGNGYISMFKVSGEVANPVFSKIGDVGTPNPWAGWAGNNGDFLPQLGSPQLINSVDHRMENVVFRNNKLWAVHHVFLPANNPQRTAVQWWELTPTGQIVQRGRIDDPTGLMSYAFPTIAVNEFEDIMVGHNNFSLNQYASAAYSFRSHMDEPNTMRDPYQYKDGKASYYKTFGGGRNRWGDYSATMLDPVNGVDFWVLQEYAELPSGGDRWGTWWAYVRIPFEPVPDFQANETLIPLGEQINFSDLTAGVPQEWSWVFDGADPASSDEQNPQGITYNTEGVFGVSLTTSNDFGTNTISKAGYISVSSTLLPDVDFETDKQVVCVNGTVKFTDKTLYMPREWEWVFTPSTISFVNGTDAFSQHPEVRFEEAVVYSVTLTAANLNGPASKTYFDLITVGGLPLPYIEIFEEPSLKASGWLIENPDNAITWEKVEVGGLEGISTAASVNFYNYYAIGQRDRLISPILDLRGFDNINLSFRHAYAKRHDQFSDSLVIYLSDDCGQTWTRIFADAENGSGNFATHPKKDGFQPVNVWDWCGVEWGADCITLNLNPWIGKTDVRIAFETYSFYGNPIYLTDIQVGPTVGIGEVTLLPDMVVSPNPSNGLFTITPKGNVPLSGLKIFSPDGRVVYKLNEPLKESMTINLKGFASGVYMVEAYAGTSRLKQKLVLLD
jgi:PKD repeat protein